MFKPTIGICTGKGEHTGCGQSGMIMTNSRRLCLSCEQKRKTKKPIKKMTDKKRENIKTSIQYYRIAIASHIASNMGKCPCEECGVNIENPSGMNVSHIIPQSVRADLYHNPLNHNILCKVGDDKRNWSKSCHLQWENGNRSVMKIYANNMKIKEELLNLNK
jgi:hypothetical protein